MALVACAHSTPRHALGLRFLGDLGRLNGKREVLRSSQRRNDHLGDYRCRLGRLRNRLVDAEIRRCLDPDRRVACWPVWFSIGCLATTRIAQPPKGIALASLHVVKPEVAKFNWPSVRVPALPIGSTAPQSVFLRIDPPKKSRKLAAAVRNM